MKRTLLKNLCALFLLFSVAWSNMGMAKPIFNLTTSSSTLIVTPGSVLSPVVFSVTNVSGVALPNLSFDANYLPLQFSTVTLDAGPTTCVAGGTLANGASCVLAVNILAGTKQGEEVFSPRVCAYNGLVCSGISCNSTTPPAVGNGIKVTVTNNAPPPIIPLKFLYAQQTFDGKVTLCNLSPTTGLITTCAPTGSNLPQPEELILTTNFTYTVNSGGGLFGVGGITVCNLNRTNGTLSGCVLNDSTTLPGFDGPEGMTMDPAQKYLFIANTLASNILRCDINTTAGTVSNCITVFTPGSNTVQPASINFNPAGTMVYIGYTGVTNHFISTCQYDSTTGTFSSCQDSDTNPALFNFAAGVNFNRSGTIAYVSNENNTINNVVTVCPIPPSGVLNSALCKGTTDPNLVNSEEVDFSSDGTLAYVANGQTSNATLAVCHVDTSGAATGFVGMLYNCVSSAPQLFGGGLGGITVTTGV